VKRLFLVSVALVFGQFTSAQAATPTILGFNNTLASCHSNLNFFVMWNGTLGQFQCVTIGTGITYTPGTGLTGVLTASAPAYTPVWAIETVSFSSVVTGSTTLTYTTLKTPIAGVILFWYSAGNLFANTYGAVAYTGQPITITLPTGWLSTDSVTFVYASQ
jgi:hypothetical protein